MESQQNQSQRWVMISLLALSAVVWIVIQMLGLKIAGALDLETRVRNIDLYVRLGSILVGVVLLFVLYRNEKSNTFMSEVVGELSRVTWPTTKETYSATFVTLIMVLISGLILWVLDNLWVYLVQAVI